MFFIIYTADCVGLDLIHPNSVKQTKAISITHKQIDMQCLGKTGDFPYIFNKKTYLQLVKREEKGRL